MNEKINWLQQKILEDFGQKITVTAIIANEIPTGSMSLGHVFMTSKKQLFCYIDSKNKMKLGDVSKIARKMGFTVECFISKNDDPDYFNRIATQKFLEIFPGRTIVGSDDLRYYKTLVEYSPALFSVSEIKNGVIYQYDTDSRTQWRPSVKFSYRRINTSL